MLQVPAIEGFFGEYRFLSNFWPCNVKHFDIDFPSAEHAYVASKTTDTNIRLQITAMAKPGEVKRFGRTIELRSDWDAIKLQTMVSIVEYKFMHNALLKQKLIATGDAELIEANTWGDTYWGVCRGKGNNYLGKILMNTRSILQFNEGQL